VLVLANIMTSGSQWHGRANSNGSQSSSSQRSESDRSDHSFSTAPTLYSLRPQPPNRYDTYDGRLEGCYDETSYHFYEDPKQSNETYVSTAPSEEDEEFSEDEAPPYELIDYPEEQHPFDPARDAIPSTPKDFATLFPSARRLSIRHDDSTIDGNMNLRVDTQVNKFNYTLFHLKMQDLKSREFSLRRYERDSGREICHSIRKYQTPASERTPALQKSFTSALAPFKKHTDSRASAVGNLKRSDSGYASVYDGRDDNSARYSVRRGPPLRIPTNTIKLEFSNYAHVNVSRRGAGTSKRYEFEYWGINYAWKRHVTREGRFEEVSYQLMRDNKPTPLAHIVPVPLTSSQAEDERRKGGWIPPCSMWLTSEDILNAMPDVAE
jgi:hypothetical protein